MSIDAETRMRRRGDPPWRRRRMLLLRRAVIAVCAAALVAATVLLVWNALAESDAEKAAERFGEAWASGDYPAMYDMLDDPSREEVDEDEFEEAYTEAAATATMTELELEDAREESGEIVLPVTASTEVFGTVSGEVRLPVSNASEIEWSPHLAFPGLAEGEKLSRNTSIPERAPILASDGTVLAEGDAGDRSSELGADAASVAGTIGSPPDREERESLFARGFPEDATVGTSGLEGIFEEEVAGTPGGVLRAGERELAASEPQPASEVRTTIDSDLQETAALALTRLGGIVVLDVDTGEVRALVGGTATTAQPPGSTFKIVTTTAALETGIVEPSTEFPVETAALIDGVTIDNAGRSACGGTFENSFAESCNSVFAPLGVDVGSEALVETAERYGVNQPSPIPGVDESTMPQPEEFKSDLELASTAIGQGRLLLTPVRLAAISETVANDGKLIEPTLDPDETQPAQGVTSRQVADTIEDLMVGVTAPGATGENAAISGIEVAGKTGTAELGEGVPEHTWFTAFAPAGKRPELAIAVMIASSGGSGGEVAAPVARTVLEAGL